MVLCAILIIEVCLQTVTRGRLWIFRYPSDEEVKLQNYLVSGGEKYAYGLTGNGFRPVKLGKANTIESLDGRMLFKINNIVVVSCIISHYFICIVRRAIIDNDNFNIFEMLA